MNEYRVRAPAIAEFRLGPIEAWVGQLPVLMCGAVWLTGVDLSRCPCAKIQTIAPRAAFIGGSGRMRL